MNLKPVVKHLIAASAALFLLSLAPCAHAATYTIDRTGDASVSACTSAPGDCGLRGAITEANATSGADTIKFDATVFAAPGPHVISLATELPHLTSNVTITGPGANVLSVKEGDANQTFSIFTMNSGVSATVSGLTLSNGHQGIANHGALTATKCTLSGNIGAILNDGDGTMSATNCTLSGNGAGIVNYSALTATNCTASGSYNGIFNAGTVTATNCTLSGNSNSGIYNYYGTLTATGCTLSGNSYGIDNRGGGMATATNCTLSGNGFGIGNDGTATATNCTLSGNSDSSIYNLGTLTATNCTASGNGVGFYNNLGTLTATNCTLSGNGLGLYSGSGGNGTLTLQNTLIAGNTINVRGSFTNGGHNITSSAAAAGLDPAGLQDNGGPTKTIALIAGSPAIDAGNSTLTTDQRGYKRPQGSAPDIGAFEFGSLPTLSVNNPRSLPEGSASAPGSITFDITLSAASTQIVTVNYQTRDGINNPATAGSDYVAKSGKLTFTPGETLKRVTVAFIGDSVAEAKETFFFDLKTPTGAIIADSRGVGTIVNDDAPPPPFLLFNSDEPSS